MISLVVCTYNRDAFIYNTLECIAKNTYPLQDYEIIVVNNNCTDNTEQECERFRASYPHIRYHYFVEENQGLSFARNRGIKESHGDIIVFLDDDAYVSDNYLFSLSEAIHQNPYMMAFGGKIIPLYETGEAPKWLSPRLMPLMSALDKGNAIILFQGKSYPIGANMGFRREVFTQIGNFNTQLGRSKKNLLGGEEKDVFERMKQDEMKILYLPQVVASHVIPESRTTKEYLRKVAFGIGASEKIRTNHSPLNYLLSILKEVWKWCGSLALWCAYLCKGNVDAANALLIFRWNVSKGLLMYK